jgi:hypothetical protein
MSLSKSALGESSEKYTSHADASIVAKPRQSEFTMEFAYLMTEIEHCQSMVSSFIEKLHDVFSQHEPPKLPETETGERCTAEAPINRAMQEAAEKVGVITEIVAEAMERVRI